MESRLRNGLCALCAGLVLSCGEHGDAAWHRGQQNAVAEAMPKSAAAAAELNALRTRFETRLKDAPEIDMPLLPRSSVTAYHESSGRFEPRFASSESPPTRVLLGATAADWSELRELSSLVSLSFRLQDISELPADFADGYIVYRGTAGTPTRVARGAPDGVEDYLLFEHAPQKAQVRYEIQLGSEVRGLRLVSDTLEVLDWEGTPRLRVSPPFLIGADGERTDAAVRIENCNVDTDPAGPWGRLTTPPDSGTCSLIVSWSEERVVYPALLDPSWSSTGSMTVPRAQHTAVYLKQQVPPFRRFILVAGGLTTGGSVTASAELFDPTTSTYAATQSMSTPRHLHTASTDSINTANAEEAVVVGGFTTRNATPASTAEQFNARSYSWSALPNMLSSGFPPVAVGRAGHGSVKIGSKVFVCGGIGSDGMTLATCGQYFGNFWEALPAMPTPRARFTMAYGYNQQGLYFPIVIGGTDGTTSAAPILALVNAWDQAWSVRGALQVPRHRHAVSRLDTWGSPPKFLVSGGISSITGQPDAVTPSTEIYDPETSVSVRSANLITPRRDHSATSIYDKVLIAGGFDSAGAATSTAEEYHMGRIAADSTGWLPGEVALDVPPVPSARGYHTAAVELQGVAYGEGRVILAGGTTAASPGASSGYSSNSQAYSTTHSNALSVRTWEYRYGAKADPLVSAPVKTEIWGTIYTPETLQTGVQYPVLVFLHGQHAHCEGLAEYYVGDPPACPPGSREIHNHRGYDYLALPLADRGFIVVSINANMNTLYGTDGDAGAILLRGRLLLRHLMMLSEWNDGRSPTGTIPPPGFPNFQGRLNLAQVGLMGHSRGGEATRAALFQYRQAGSVWPSNIPGLNVRGIFEIAPTDYIASQAINPQALNAAGVKWVTLLPMCDGDVVALEGIRPFDRMLLEPIDNPAGFKASYAVWGANHNFYNTKWLAAEDGASCANHRQLSAWRFPNAIWAVSGEQRQTGFLPIYRFFAATVGSGADITQARIFNPAYATPPEPRIDRGFTPSTASSQALMLENFTGTAGTGSYGIINGSSGVTVTHGTIAEHAPTLRGGAFSWTSTGSGKYFQSNWSASGTGFNLSTYAHLELRIERTSSSTSTSNVTVQLVNSNNTLSGSVSLASYVKLTAPVGSFRSLHTMLQSARIPLSAFSNATLAAIRGVKVSFTTNGADAFVIANIRATKAVSGQPLFVAEPALVSQPAGSQEVQAVITSATVPVLTISAGNRVLSVRSVAGTATSTPSVALELESTELFGIRDALLMLNIASSRFSTFRYSSPDGRTSRVTFSIPRSSFDQLKNGDPIRAGYPNKEWDFGTLDKARLDR